MKRLVIALALAAGLPVFASAKSADLAFELSSVPVGRIVNVIYADALKTPYVLAPELLADQRPVSFRFAGSVLSVKADLVKLLDSLGYAVTKQGGGECSGPKKEP